MTTVTITEEPMSLDDLLAVVQGAQVEIDDTVRARMASSRAVVDRALAANDAVYGLTTQVGHGRDTRLTDEEVRSQQMFLIMSHGGGVGPALAVPLVRAALAVRLNGGSVHSVQDALSVRVVPQVHGALRHFVAALHDAVVQELNAASDNPLVSTADQTMISNGNFHPMVMAIAADALRIAVTHVGQLSERRMAHLWEALFARLEAGPPRVAPAGMRFRYPAAAVFSELRHLAATGDPRHPSAGSRHRGPQHGCPAHRPA